MAEYWIEVTRQLAGMPETKAALTDCGLTFVRTGPSWTLPGTEIQTEFWLMSDPAAGPELHNKTVELVVQRYMKDTTPDFGDGPTMDVIYFPRESYRIIERKVR